MATKIFCDGCDADITDAGGNSRRGIRLSASTQDGNVKLGQFECGPYDLCGACVDRFRAVANPHKWARASV